MLGTIGAAVGAVKRRGLRRSWFALLCLLLMSLSGVESVAAAITVSSARLWPASDYTRLTLESSTPIQYQYFTIKDPERLVIDLQDVDIGQALEALAGKVSASDPYIKQIRVGRFKPGVVRVVLDLKTAVKPSVFSLKPYGQYGDRLVVDVYPAQPADGLMALLQAPGPDQAAAGTIAGDGAKSSAGGDKAENAGAAGVSDAKSGKEAADAGTTAKQGKGRMKTLPGLSRTITIAIDPGHGGEDPGARGQNGAEEKNVTLAIARKLQALVNAQPNMRGVLTRDGDYFVPLGTRVAKARAMKADLFVSIHADAYVKPHASGSSVFALSERGATSAAARWLAKRENDADLIGGVNLDVKDPYLARTLLDLSQTATINDSLKLGKDVLGQLGEVNNLHRGVVEQAGFAVLKAPDIPSILVETAFITNPAEERKLVNPDYQEKLAKAILGGIEEYFAQNPPLAKPRLAQN